MTERIVRYQESALSTSDGLELYAQSWFVNEPKAVVAIVHGIAEHGSRYRHVAEFLAEHGYDVHTFDLRGHGRSPGQRTLVKHMDEHSEDVMRFLNWVQRERHGHPGAAIRQYRASIRNRPSHHQSQSKHSEASRDRLQPDT